jgi:16S rRNA (cytosine967-C5)-methyltransferase
MGKTVKKAGAFRKSKASHYGKDLPADSLAFSLLGAAHAIIQFEQGKSLPNALSAVFENPKVTPQASGAIQDIAYRAVRQLGLTRVLVDTMTNKIPEQDMIRALLYCSLALLIELNDEEKLPYEPFTAVDQSVFATTLSPVFYAKALVNALLRRFLREKKELLASARKKKEALWLYPEWWINATQTAYPNHWEAILKEGNVLPPLTLRINQRKTSMDAYLRELGNAGVQASVIGEFAIRLKNPVPVSQIPGFNEGLVSVQDAAAQLAAPHLDLDNGMRVLDACAAPGGKTGHILETADVHVTALDIDAQRLKRVKENLQRLELNALVKEGDASKQNWWDGVRFDRILADVPCTASGVVRRHPDIRWLRRETDIQQLATFSEKILDNLWQMLQPSGKLLFITCSIWPLESEMQASAFADRNRATRLDSFGQLLPESGEKLNQDGLFYALFQKNDLD